jgi:hypothetical protein
MAGIRDIKGNKLEQGDEVAIAVGGELSAGVIVHIDTGLANLTSGPGNPYVVVQVGIARAITANGVALGIFKVADEEKKSEIIQ